MCVGNKDSEQKLEKLAKLCFYLRKVTSAREGDKAKKRPDDKFRREDPRHERKDVKRQGLSLYTSAHKHPFFSKTDVRVSNIASSEINREDTRVLVFNNQNDKIHVKRVSFYTFYKFSMIRGFFSIKLKLN